MTQILANLIENKLTYCSVVTVLALVVLTKKHFGHYAILKKGMSGQSIISIISTDLGPFGANSVITFGFSFSIRWYTSIFLK